MKICKTQAAAALALAGALVSTAANAGDLYGPGYAYGSYPDAYQDYAYVPAPAPVYSYGPARYSHGYVPAPAPAPVYSYGPAYYSYGYVPAPTYSYRYGYRSVYDPENGNDPDGRIGGSFKMNTSGKD
jgi:hypothetical protein